MLELLFLVASVKSGEDFSLWHLQYSVAWDDRLGHLVAQELRARS